MSDLKQFNTVMLEFFDQLSIYNNKSVNFKMYKSMADACIKLDESSLNLMFNKTVTNRFYDEILNKNEMFFLELNDYTDVCANDLNFINYLKHVWKNTDDEEKTKIWDFLNVLLYLDKKINS